MSKINHIKNHCKTVDIYINSHNQENESVKEFLFDVLDIVTPELIKEMQKHKTMIIIDFEFQFQEYTVYHYDYELALDLVLEVINVSLN